VSKVRVEIANPKPGEAKFTTWNRAQKYIFSGRAIVTSDDGKLYFLRDKKDIESRLDEIRRMSEYFRLNPEKMGDEEEPSFDNYFYGGEFAGILVKKSKASKLRPRYSKKSSNTNFLTDT